VYSLDIYTHIYDWLGAALKELKEAGIEQPRIIIQETNYNDPESLREIQRVGRDFGLRYEYLMQWNKRRGHPVKHFSDDYAAEYGAYLGKP